MRERRDRSREARAELDINTIVSHLLANKNTNLYVCSPFQLRSRTALKERKRWRVNRGSGTRQRRRGLRIQDKRLPGRELLLLARAWRPFEIGGLEMTES